MAEISCSMDVILPVAEIVGYSRLAGQLQAKGKDLRYQHAADISPTSCRLLIHLILILVPRFWIFLFLCITYWAGCEEHDKSQILLFPQLPAVHSFRMGFFLGGPNHSSLTGALPAVAVNPVCCCCMNWVRKPQHSLLESQIVMRTKTGSFFLSLLTF